MVRRESREGVYRRRWTKKSPYQLCYSWADISRAKERSGILDPIKEAREQGEEDSRDPLSYPKWVSKMDPETFPRNDTGTGLTQSLWSMTLESGMGLTQGIESLRLGNSGAEWVDSNDILSQEVDTNKLVDILTGLQCEAGNGGTGLTQGMGSLHPNSQAGVIMGGSHDDTCQEVDTNGLVDILTDLQNSETGVGDTKDMSQEVDTNGLVDILTDLQCEAGGHDQQCEAVNDTTSEISISLLDTSSQRRQLEH